MGGAFALAIEPMAATFETPLSREHPHRVITLDPNIRPMLIDDHTTVRARLRRWLGMTDIVKAPAPTTFGGAEPLLPRPSCPSHELGPDHTSSPPTEASSLPVDVK